ncbi:MAG: efflux transporter periplasmic adaptor subunit [Gammaproteobacteria bacterium]|jgi:Cu(I)/Ag(I) efflux system membrane fusion protein|nr:efflux transporter periplasmic adaptor subunit [Gammaproteobacteria bacterium]|tara:strand:- start:2119 stop:3414 length:1296 start_codon:yes stop_codon:yes gene_type:complete
MTLARIVLIALIAAGAGFLAAQWYGPGASGASSGESSEREVLYWAAPMDPNFRSDKPGKSPMGMDLVPVYADEAAGGASDEPALRISAAVVNNIGVKITPVERGTIYRNIETVGFIMPDQERVAHVHVRTEGWIEHLAADTEGDFVSEGDLLFEIYSPALVSAQDEYLQAVRADQPVLVEAAASRLRALGMLSEQIQALRRDGRTTELFSVRSPQDGYLTGLNVREGMFVEPGTTIMTLADLSEVWVDVDVFEQQIDWIDAGQTARMRLPFAPEREWEGSVDYVYPTIRPESRTARVRLVFANPDLALKPHMYAKVDIDADPRHDVLYAPSQSIIRTGAQERVIIDLGDGRFRPAEVETGVESGGRVEVRRGLEPDDRIVVSSQFLIDSEASLDASLLRLLGDSQEGTHHDHAVPDDSSTGDHAGHFGDQS